jgi:ribonuclease Z
MGFIDRVCHKLHAYEWDLVDRYDTDLVFTVTELRAKSSGRRARLRFKNGFDLEDDIEVELPNGVVASASGFEARATILDHHGPCLGFAIAERAHANVWKTVLDHRGLPTGPWLQELKRAVLEGLAGDHLIVLPGGGTAPLQVLRDIVTVTRGQKIAYVTEVADSARKRAAIAALAEGADTLFIEARFGAADAVQARDRAHLTTTAAGEIARMAGVRKVEPFHFSQRYDGEEERMLAEVHAAFQR